MRTEKLDALAGKKCDTVFLISNADRPDRNLEYYSGMNSSLASGAVMWKVGKEPLLVARDTNQRKKIRAVGKKTGETAYEELKKLRPKRVGINMDYVSVNWMKRMRKKTGAKFVDISRELETARAVKESSEIKSISRACDETRRVLKNLKVFGRSEGDVYSDIVSAYAKKALPLAFNPIVASGKNTRLIHSFPSGKRIAVGDTVIVDTGCRVNGYCSDLTKTYCAKPNEKTSEMLFAVFGASKLALREARPGITANELCEMVGEYLGKHSKHWIYGLGHGVGLDVHEYPSLALGSGHVLEEGMVFTLEPGLVGPGQGARIEYTGVLKKGGFKKL